VVAVPYLSVVGLVVLDEIQLRPELFPVLRVLADRPRRPARWGGSIFVARYVLIVSTQTWRAISSIGSLPAGAPAVGKPALLPAGEWERRCQLQVARHCRYQRRVLPGGVAGFCGNPGAAPEPAAPDRPGMPPLAAGGTAGNPLDAELPTPAVPIAETACVRATGLLLVGRVTAHTY
jgi:hypothetical protein